VLKREGECRSEQWVCAEEHPSLLGLMHSGSKNLRNASEETIRNWSKRRRDLNRWMLDGTKNIFV
jgi:hypothetical protein